MSDFLTDLDLVRVRELILRDTVALSRWPRIVDCIVGKGAAELEIKGLIRDYNFGEAVLQTLRIWQAAGNERGHLPEILRQHGLNELAEKIEDLKNQPASASASTSARPIWFDVGHMVPNFVGREDELVSLHQKMTQPRNNESVKANIVYIVGLGGVGKSALARKYAFKYAKDTYDGNVAWIHGETCESMEGSFRRLAKCMNLVFGSTEELCAEVVAKVYERLDGKKCLFIFDNVQDKTILNKFLPKITSAAGTQILPYLLVTSCQTDLTFVKRDEHQLVLKTLKKTEAVEFITKQVPAPQKASAEALALKLHNLPLALQQAVAYIIEEETYFEDDEKSIDKYLAAFEQQAAMLLSNTKFQEHVEDYTSTVLTTWTMTLGRIKKLPKGDQAEQIISVMAYLSPDHISVEFLRNVFAFEPEPGLHLLKKYSMTDASSQSASIHCLVQTAIRSTFDSEQEKSILGQIIPAWGNLLRTSTYDDMARECIAHSLHAVPYQVKHRELINYNDCLVVLHRNLNKFWYVSQNIQLCEQVARACETFYGDKHRSTLEWWLRHAQVFGRKGDLQLSIAKLRALANVSEIEFGNGDELTNEARLTVGNILMVRGEFQDAVSAFDKIPSMKEPIEGESDSLLMSQFVYAMSLRLSGKHEESAAMMGRVVDSLKRMAGADQISGIEFNTLMALPALFQPGSRDDALDVIFNGLGNLVNSLPEFNFVPNFVNAVRAANFDEAVQIVQSAQQQFFKPWEDFTSPFTFQRVRSTILSTKKFVQEIREKNPEAAHGFGRPHWQNILNITNMIQPMLRTMTNDEMTQENEEKSELNTLFLSHISSMLGGAARKYIDRQEKLTHLHQLLVADETENKLIIITGARGTGKTTFVTQYTADYHYFFDDNVIWLRGENYEKLQTSILRLASRVKVCICDYNTPRNILTKIHSQCIGADKKCLFIIDDVPPDILSNLEQLLPTNSANIYSIIITTSCPAESTTEELLTREFKLPPFSMNDIIQFILSQLPGLTESDAKVLANRLHNHPLALTQALACIQHGSGVDATQNVHEYLAEFNQLALAEANKFTTFKHLETNQHQLIKVINATTTLSLNKLRSVKNGATSAAGLKVLVCVDDYKRTSEYLHKHFNPVKTSVVLDLLWRFGLVTLAQDGFVAINHVVENFVKMSMSEEGLDALRELTEDANKQDQGGEQEFAAANTIDPLEFLD